MPETKQSPCPEFDKILAGIQENAKRNAARCVREMKTWQLHRAFMAEGRDNDEPKDKADSGLLDGDEATD